VEDDGEMECRSRDPLGLGRAAKFAVSSGLAVLAQAIHGRSSGREASDAAHIPLVSAVDKGASVSRSVERAKRAGELTCRALPFPPG
jgi:hypothetical protein